MSQIVFSSLHSLICICFTIEFVLHRRNHRMVFICSMLQLCTLPLALVCMTVVMNTQWHVSKHWPYSCLSDSSNTWVVPTQKTTPPLQYTSHPPLHHHYLASNPITDSFIFLLLLSHQNTKSGSNSWHLVGKMKYLLISIRPSKSQIQMITFYYHS